MWHQYAKLRMQSRVRDIREQVRALRHPRAAVRDLEGRRFDKRFGVNTDATATLSSLTVVSGDRCQGLDYVPEPPRVTRWWLEALPARLGEFTFVDLGSGMGSVLLLAASRARSAKSDAELWPS
jgi:hypothetical protein